MPLATRVICLLVVLCGAAAGQAAIARRLSADAPPRPGTLRAPLAALPLELGPWIGEDRPIDDDRWLYADEHLQRIYRHRHTGQTVWLWMAFSTTGVDRGHHPQVCMAVAGRPEDRSIDPAFEAFDAAPPLAQFRFGDDGDAQRVYYWHYTLPSPDESGLDALGRAFWRLRQRPASLSMELAATEQSTEEIADVEALVRLIALAIDTNLAPANAQRGSRRLPVAIVTTDT